MSMPPPPPPPGSVPPPPPGFGGPSYGGPSYGGPAPAWGSSGGFPGAPSYGYDGGRNYAGFGSRLGGYLLDTLLYGLLSSVFVIPAIVLGIGAFDGCSTRQLADNTTDVVCPPGKPEGGLLAVAILLGVVGFLVVAVLYVRALGRTGQTWGRKIVGIRVVGRDTGDSIGIGKAILRCVVAGVISGNCILGYLWMLWDKDKQTWHDKVAGTVVVRV